MRRLTDKTSQRTGKSGYKSGSHYLVSGNYHNYFMFGGMVVGTFNTSPNANASVTGGWSNTASGHSSSVSGGGGLFREQ